jgi:DNA-directed RNA polymerase subunit omega
MARVTVEECVIRVPNRFELVHVAARRSQELNNGAHSLLPQENDKNTILSLREIEEGAVDPQELRESIIRGYRDMEEQDTLPDEETFFEESFINVPVSSKPLSWNGSNPESDEVL